MPLRVHTRVYASRRNAHGLGSLSAFGNKWRRTVGVVTVEVSFYTPLQMNFSRKISGRRSRSVNFRLLLLVFVLDRIHPSHRRVSSISLIYGISSTVNLLSVIVSKRLDPLSDRSQLRNKFILDSIVAIDPFVERDSIE